MEIKDILQRRIELDNERQPFHSVWRKCSEYIQPTKGRFLFGDATSKKKVARFNPIIDDEAGRALNTLSAGLLAGMTSPARPWFRLAMRDPDLNEYQPVKSWLEQVRKIMMRVMAKSNMYRVLHGVYTDLGLFGTAAAQFDLDLETVVHGYNFGAGEFWADVSDRGGVDELYREFAMTPKQLAQKFGYDNLPSHVKDALRDGNANKKYTVACWIAPRVMEERAKFGPKSYPWKVIYLLKGEGDKDSALLYEGGHKFQRFVVPRWQLQTGDIYGHGPAMQVIGAVIDLQRDMKMKRKVVDYKADPPVQVPTSMKGKTNMLPGGISYYNAAEGPNTGIRTAFEISLDLAALLESIQDTRRRIQQAFFVDIFLMITQLNETRTATEIAARQEEKMLMLGPVLERLHDELLNPLVQIVFQECLQGKILPPPPAELNNKDLTVEYLSVLAQAQKMIALQGTDRMVGMLGTLAQLKPEALDKLDADKAVDAYADALGVNPDMIVGNEQVALIRQQRAQAQAQAEQAAMEQQQAVNAQQVANAVKTASEIDQNKINEAMSIYSGL